MAGLVPSGEYIVGLRKNDSRAVPMQFQFRVGPGNFCCVHVSLVPVLGVVGEQKTKPTQHSVAVLRSLGLNPHLLACRSQDPLSPAVRDKLVSDRAWLYRHAQYPNCSKKSYAKQTAF